MKIFNFKLGLFSLLTMFAASVILTSCQKELSTSSKTEDLNLPSKIYMNSLDTSQDESFEQLESPPERSADNTNTEVITERWLCWSPKAWNNSPDLGWIYIYSSNSLWVWSHNLQTFLQLEDLDDLCSYGVKFKPYTPICNRNGWFYDGNPDDTIVLYWNGNEWEKINTAQCIVFVG